MQRSQLWHPWLPYLFIFRPDRAVVGLGGFKSVPDAQRTIEIGYSVAPTYQSRGFATSAARQLIGIAFESKLVDCVRAHTLAEQNASTRVLKKWLGISILLWGSYANDSAKIEAAPKRKSHESFSPTNFPSNRSAITSRTD
jgi:hypothetical protein